MDNSHFSRRQFIKTLGIAGGVALLGSSLDANAQTIPIPIRKKCPEPGATIRKNFKNLTPAELAAYKHGVAVMQARPITDPTSWAYQAAIHGTFTTPAQTAWNTCQHNTTFFYSWHRMYICFFERILRKASGLASLGLPYWNYSDSADPNARQLPAAFRTPATAANPLYTSSRNAGINAGGFLSASAVSLAAAIPDSTDFFTFTNNVNGTPHGAVHVSVGGWMGAFETAGQDPIFWLHHCNIDRLWNRWISAGGGRQNPITDSAWLYTPFTFFDENGKQVKMTGADLINPNCSMCKYCYDEETVGFDFSIDYLPYRSLKLLIGYVEKPVVLGENTVTLDLTLNDKAKDAFARVLSAKAGEPATIRLNFDEAKADKPLNFYYEVYLNLAKDAREPNPEIDNYAGNISFFGIESKQSHDQDHEKTRFSVNISEGVRKLPKQTLNDKKILVTLVPTGLVSADGKKLPIRSDAKAEIGRITLTME